MRNFKWYRRWKGGTWYKHQFTEDAAGICLLWVGKTFWAGYDAINRYSRVLEVETYEQ